MINLVKSVLPKRVKVYLVNDVVSINNIDVESAYHYIGKLVSRFNAVRWSYDEYSCSLKIKEIIQKEVE